MSEFIPLLVRRDQVERVRRGMKRSLRPVRGGEGVFVDDRDDSLVIVGQGGGGAAGAGLGAGIVDYCEIVSYDTETRTYTVDNKVTGGRLSYITNIMEVLHTSGGLQYLEFEGILADDNYFLHQVWFPLYRTSAGTWFLAYLPPVFL